MQRGSQSMSQQMDNTIRACCSSSSPIGQHSSTQSSGCTLGILGDLSSSPSVPFLHISTSPISQRPNPSTRNRLSQGEYLERHYNSRWATQHGLARDLVRTPECIVDAAAAAAPQRRFSGWASAVQNSRQRRQSSQSRQQEYPGERRMHAPTLILEMGGLEVGTGRRPREYLNPLSSVLS